MTDWELVSEILLGKREKYALIVEKYKNTIFNLAYRFTNDYTEAQDLSQEVFVHVFLQLSKFHNQATFSTWLYRLATNKCIDWQRKRKKEPHFSPIEEDINGSYTYNPENTLIKKERSLWLQEAISRLPLKYKIVIVLYHTQGLSYQEIGKILNLPEKTVATRLYRGKKILKNELNLQKEVVQDEVSGDRVKTSILYKG